MTHYQKPNLNVWKFGWGLWKYPANWPGNIKHIFRCIKWSFQRIVRGYCDFDVWDLDSYYCDLIHNSLLELRDTTHGFPYDLDEKTWSAWLTETADCFYKGNEGNNAFTNPYEEEMSKLHEKWTSEEMPDGCVRLKTNYTPEDEQISQLYFDVEKENAMKRKLSINHGLQRLAARWHDLWD